MTGGAEIGLECQRGTADTLGLTPLLTLVGLLCWVALLASSGAQELGPGMVQSLCTEHLTRTMALERALEPVVTRTSLRGASHGYATHTAPAFHPCACVCAHVLAPAPMRDIFAQSDLHLEVSGLCENVAHRPWIWGDIAHMLYTCILSVMEATYDLHGHGEAPAGRTVAVVTSLMILT